jgi:AraC-like DNA-binding protein
VGIELKAENEFLAAPRRSGFVRGHVAVWCADEELQGYAVWGLFTADVARQVFSLVGLVRGALPRGPKRKVVISLDRLTGVDWTGVEEVMRLRGESHAQSRSAGVDLFEAVVRPQGVIGAIVAGAYQMFVATKLQRVHASLGDALRWLDRADETEPVGAFLRAATARRSRIVDELRTYLDTHLEEGSLVGAARALGVARRTLQLELARERTSFRAVRDEMRLREAKRRLAESGHKLEHLARELGFRSTRHFYKWFRGHTGRTPGDWRHGATS